MLGLHGIVRRHKQPTLTLASRQVGYEQERIGKVLMRRKQGTR
jgi:hypothetical protein